MLAPLRLVHYSGTALLGACLIGLLLPVQAVHAHALGENYVFLNFLDSAIEGRFEFHLDDVRDKIGVDLRANGADPAKTIDASTDRVHEYIRRNFDIGPVEGTPYEIEFTSQSLNGTGSYARYYFRAITGPLPDIVRIRHEMGYEDDWIHRGLILVNFVAKTDTTYPEERTAMVFSPLNAEQTLNLLDVPKMLRARDMVWQGVVHIWFGLDHVLFLVAVILPLVLTRTPGGTWEPVQRFPVVWWKLLKIITAFTVAHSVTLLLAALGFIEVPSRLVESVIALSIIIVAALNIMGSLRAGAVAVIVFLGLFHGLGFASVMGDLPFRMNTLVKSVIGFNIGVELGQIAIVAVCFPALYWARGRNWYAPVVLRGGSGVLISVAGVWFVQRAFGLG